MLYADYESQLITYINMFALKSYIKKTITANEQVIEWTLQKRF